MIIDIRSCGKCSSTNLIKYGKNCAGSPRCKCNACGSVQVLKPKRPECTEERMELVAKAYQERNSTRSTGRIFGISHTTVQAWLKKKQGR